jgi:hypothetical protein
MCLGIIGLERDCLLVARHRVVRAPERRERDAEVVVSVRDVGVSLQRPLQVLDGVLVPAFLGPDCTHPVQRFEISGVLAQHGLKQPLRLVQPALPLKRRGLIHELLEFRLGSAHDRPRCPRCLRACARNGHARAAGP